MKHQRLAALVALTAAGTLLISGCTSSSSGDSSSDKPSSSSSAKPSEAGPDAFTPSSELPEDWPSEVPGVDGFILIGTFNELAPATGAVYTATWQQEEDQFDLLSEHISALEDNGWKKTGEFTSDEDAKVPSVSYTLTKGDWILAYTATMSGPNTVVNQMLIPVEPAKTDTKPGTDKESASAKPDTKPSAKPSSN